MATLAGCSSSSSETTPTPTTTEEPTAEFRLQEIVSDDTFKPGDQIEPQVTVENVGEKTGTAILKFTIGSAQELKEVEVESESITTASVVIDASNIEEGGHQVKVEAESDAISKSIDVFEAPDSGVYGAIESAREAALSDHTVDLAARKDGEYKNAYEWFDENGHFTLSHPFEPPYEAMISFSKQQLGVFNGLPPVYEFSNSVISSDPKFVGVNTLPEAYRTEIRFVSPDGEPVTDLQAASIRSESGQGVGPERLTTDSDGYLTAKESSKTGVALPAKSETTYEVEIQPGDWSTREVIGEAYGSEDGEEFTFTIENPSKYK